MEGKLRDSSKAIREISFIATAWLRDIHHSLQQQEIRLEQVEQDARNQERGANANTADIGCMQINQELHGKRLERLEGIVHLQGQALLTQERMLKGVGEGEKKIGGELRVQNKRRKEKESTCCPRACPAVGAEGQRASIGKLSTFEILTGLLETSVGEVTSQKEVKGALKRSPGVWKSTSQPQGSGPRRGDKSEPEGSRKSLQ